MTLEDRFDKLVMLVQRDIKMLQDRLNAISTEHGQLKQELAGLRSQRSMNGVVTPSTGVEDAEFVTVHPVTGKPMKAADMPERLRMQLAFSEDE